jgi:hypothetical protein
MQRLGASVVAFNPIGVQRIVTPKNPHYSPALKRWMSADPVTVHEAGSDINPYSYGNSNPTAYVDPDGRLAFLAVVAIVAIAAVVSGTANAVQQYAQTGEVHWMGKGGVFAAAGIGAVGAVVGCGIGALAGWGTATAIGSVAASGTWGGALVGAVGGAAGGAASGMTGAL